MKHQALFCSKDKSEKIKVSSATVLLGCRKKDTSCCQVVHSFLCLGSACISLDICRGGCKNLFIVKVRASVSLVNHLNH